MARPSSMINGFKPVIVDVSGGRDARRDEECEGGTAN